MADDLPAEFDLIVVGTGFTESCIAAAASRIGKTVLHVDPNDFYGGSWASFSIHNLNSFIDANSNGVMRNASYKWHIPDGGTNTESSAEQSTELAANKIWSRDELMQISRRFNLDLCPKVIYSAGKLVQLLISSNICRYAEFRAVDHVCTQFENNTLRVPCSRSDVFNTKDLTIIEKRLLMKFLQTCMDHEDNNSSEDHRKTFYEYLKGLNLTEKINTCIMQAIAMCPNDTPFQEGMERTKKFLSSLGRYGNTPFLFPMYGCGEIPQCFCRLCAVFGGIYCLKQAVDEITINADTNSSTVQLNGRSISSRYVVCSHTNLPDNLLQGNVGLYGLGALANSLSRAIFITSTPLGGDDLNSLGGGVNVLRLVSEHREAFLIQLSHYSGVCPKGLYVFYFTTPAASDNPEADLEPFINQVFDRSRNSPQLVYSAFFSLTARMLHATPVDAFMPVFVTAGPYYEVDYDLAISNARDIFSKMYPNEEFLPRAPDPEEIVVDGEDASALNEHSLPEDLREHLHNLQESVEQLEIEKSSTQQMDTE